MYPCIKGSRVLDWLELLTDTALVINYNSHNHPEPLPVCVTVPIPPGCGDVSGSLPVLAASQSPARAGETHTGFHF